jgi:hypothetical protein
MRNSLVFAAEEEKDARTAESCIRLFRSNIKEIPQQAEKCVLLSATTTTAIWRMHFSLMLSAATTTISRTQKTMRSSQIFDGIICTNPFANITSPHRGPHARHTYVLCMRVCM